MHQNAARLIRPVQCSKLEMGEEGRSETANRQPGLLHWLEVLHREVLDQAERTSCMVAPPQFRIERKNRTKRKHRQNAVCAGRYCSNVRTTGKHECQTTQQLSIRRIAENCAPLPLVRTDEGAEEKEELIDETQPRRAFVGQIQHERVRIRLEVALHLRDFPLGLVADLAPIR